MAGQRGLGERARANRGGLPGRERGGVFQNAGGRDSGFGPDQEENGNQKPETGKLKNLRISGGDAENLNMPVGKIDPVVDGTSRSNGDVYSASL